MPPEILARRDKIGFEAPEQELVRSLVTERDRWFPPLQELGYLDDGWIAKNIERLPVTRKGAKHAWRIICLGMWLRSLGSTSTIR